jgi:hypothetical protein
VDRDVDILAALRKRDGAAWLARERQRGGGRLPTEADSIQVTTELLDNLPQVARVLFDQSPRLLHAWRFWLWRFFASVLFARLARELDDPSHG